MTIKTKLTYSAGIFKVNPWVMWAVMASFTMFQFFLQAMPTLIVSDLRATYEISAEGVSLIASSYFYVYVLMQVPSGMLLDVFGCRRVQIVASFILCIGCLVFSLADNLAFAVIARVLMGFGASCIFVGLLTVSKDWFAREKFPVIVACGETIGMVGNALLTVIFSFVVMKYGWRMMCWLSVVVLAIFMVAILGLLQDAPARKEITWQVAFVDFRKSLKQVLCCRAIWLCGIFGGLLFAIITLYAGLWAVPYLMRQYQYSLSQATIVASMVYYGFALAAPLVGWLTTRVSWRWLMISGAFISLMLVMIVLYVPNLSMSNLILLTFLLGLGSSVYVVNYMVVRQFAPAAAESTALGLANGLVMAPAAIIQPLIGFFVHLPYQGMADGSMIYTASDYQRGLTVLPICFALGIIFACLLPSVSLKQKAA